MSRLQIILIDGDGCVIRSWRVPEDVGDLGKPLGAAQFVNDVREAIEEVPVSDDELDPEHPYNERNEQLADGGRVLKASNEDGGIG